MMIKVSDLSHSYDDVLAVNDVSFEISAGEIVGLLGHNGAGKSTIMKILTGFLRPVKGNVWLNEEDLWNNLSSAQTEIGYLPENNILYSEMTVADYLVYTGVLHGLDEKLILPLLKVALEKTNLESKASQTIGTLSKGFRQRVGVAQAILHKPKVLILDEPTNGLDPTQVQQMRGTIRNLSDNNTAVILSTHVLKEVESICSRVLVIKEGRKVMDSKLTELSGGQKLLVTVDQNLEGKAEVSNRLSEITSIDFLEKNSSGYRYTLSPKQEGPIEFIGPQVASLIVGAGVGLLELQREKRDLETVFNEI